MKKQAIEKTEKNLNAKCEKLLASRGGYEYDLLKIVIRSAWLLKKEEICLKYIDGNAFSLEGNLYDPNENFRNGGEESAAAFAKFPVKRDWAEKLLERIEKTKVPLCHFKAIVKGKQSCVLDGDSFEVTVCGDFDSAATCSWCGYCPEEWAKIGEIADLVIQKFHEECKARR